MTKLGDLTQDPANFRVHTPRNLAAIEDSLSRAGAGRSVLAVRDADGHLVLLAGNATVEAAGNIGLEEVEIVESDGTRLVVVVRTDLSPTDDQAEWLKLADNRAAELAKWDVPRLLALPLQVQEAFFTPVELGRLHQTLDRPLEEILGELAAQDEAEPGSDDEEDELTVETLVKTGDVWALDDHLLVCGDASSALFRAYFAGVWFKSGAEPALIATDPPYGIDYEALQGQTRNLGSRRNQKVWERLAGDAPEDGSAYDPHDPETVQVLEDLVFGAIRGIGARTAIIWHPQLELRLAFWRAMDRDFWHKRQEIVWVKDAPVFSRNDYHWQHETATIFTKPGHYSSANRTLTTVWTAARVDARMHPTQKPLALYATPLLHHTAPGELVYDPFAGTGTCLMAAEETGRTAHLGELVPFYCDHILARWQAHTGRQPERIASIHD